MSAFYFVFGFIGTMASIVALIVELMRSRRGGLAILGILAVLLSGFSGYAFFRYRQATDEKLVLSGQKKQASAEAAELVKKIPYSPNYYSPGQCRGIVFAGLAFFEQHKALYPSTYEAISKTVLKDIDYAQAHPDSSDERHTMETAADSIIQALRALAGGALE